MNKTTIIYDGSFPLCAAYSKSFVKIGLIEKEGRKDFSNLSTVLLQQIDIKRSLNEIPLRNNSCIIYYLSHFIIH